MITKDEEETLKKALMLVDKDVLVAHLVNLEKYCGFSISDQLEHLLYVTKMNRSGRKIDRMLDELNGEKKKVIRRKNGKRRKNKGRKINAAETANLDK